MTEAELDTVARLLGDMARESPSQRFAREILKEPAKSGFHFLESNKPRQPKEEKPSYVPRHKLTLRSWDDNVDVVKLLNANFNSLNGLVGSLERSGDNHYQMIQHINEELKRLKQETLKAKFINAVKLAWKLINKII